MTLQAGILVVILFTHKGFQRPRRKRLKKLGSRSLGWIYEIKKLFNDKKEAAIHPEKFTETMVFSLLKSYPSGTL